MFRPLLASAVIGLAITGPLSAQDWIIDAQASSVTAETRVFGQSAEAQFETFSADIVFDPQDLENASISARVSAASGSMSNREYQSALVSRDGLAPDQHDEIIFVSDEIVAAGDGYEARGQLTLKGETRDAVLPFTVEIENGRAVAQGTLEIVRADFGVGSSSWSEVAPSVTVRLRIEADAG